MHDVCRHQKLFCTLLRSINHRFGFMPFDQWMSHALYYPKLGYYNNKYHPFGSFGDYVTLPMRSSLFGKYVGQFLYHCMRAKGLHHLIEIGVGGGYLADAIADVFIQHNYTLYYGLYEQNMSLYQRRLYLQKGCVQFRHLSHLPNHFCGMVLANEWLDALPVCTFSIYNQQFYERLVQWKDGCFRWIEIVAQPPFYLNSLMNRVYYMSEYNRYMDYWMHWLGKHVSRGGVLFLDYGYSQSDYYNPHRLHGTLCSFYQHQMIHEVLIRPGLQDISAHVDFSLVARHACHAGFKIDFFMPQSILFSLVDASMMFDASLIDQIALKTTLCYDTNNFYALFLSKDMIFDTSEEFFVYNQRNVLSRKII